MGDATHYELLGLHPGDGPEHVRAAYRRVSVRVHPDAGGTDALFRQVHGAYRTLADPVRRAEYDDRLRRGAAGTAGPERGPTWSTPAPPRGPAAGLDRDPGRRVTRRYR
jgi:curved DNA-binding protein CbpA